MSRAGRGAKRKSSDDGDYFDSSLSKAKGSSRPGYESARPTVQARQGYKRSKSGGFKFLSAIDGVTKHRLDHKGRESIPQKPDKKGKARSPLLRQPALDHIVQYVALKQVHDETTTAERGKAARGLQRRLSVDLIDTFRNAVADPTNLRLVSHGEHSAQGGHKTRASLTPRDMGKAQTLYNKHLTGTDKTETPQNSNIFRPAWHTPFPGTGGTVSAPTVTTRSRSGTV